MGVLAISAEVLAELGAGGAAGLVEPFRTGGVDPPHR
jgi:hypothetical protein